MRPGVDCRCEQRPPHDLQRAGSRLVPGAFEPPTRAQQLGWPPIAAGSHTLLLAPTGSGKTLAAFLSALDGLARDPAERGTRVLYVSPLKALNHDIERNLRAPLAGITFPRRPPSRSAAATPRSASGPPSAAIRPTS